MGWGRRAGVGSCAMTSQDRRVELLHSVWLFSDCTDDEVAHIAKAATTREVAAGTELCSEGDPGEEFFAVVDGAAEARKAGKKVGTLDAGSCFGEMALIAGGERMATVVTTAPTSLLVLSRANFTSLLAAVPTVAPKLMQVMGQRIRELATASGNALPF